MAKRSWLKEVVKVFVIIVFYTAFLITQRIIEFQPDVPTRATNRFRNWSWPPNFRLETISKELRSPILSWEGISSKVFSDTENVANVNATRRPRLPRNDTRKYVTTGSRINCQQRPLNENGTHTDIFDWPPKKVARFAYAWYVTLPHYFCSALTAMKSLKNIRAKRPLEKFDYQVDFVLVHAMEDILSPESKDLVKKWYAEGGKTHQFPSYKKFVKSSYYKGSLQKFQVFLLKNYTRVIAMDADGVALNNLDHLFLLKFPTNVSIAAPQGYWFKNEGVVRGDGDSCNGMVYPMITSILLLFEPSQVLFDRVQEHFGTRRPVSKLEFFDMDIIQKEFSCPNEMFVLPKPYGTLDSDFNRRFTLYRKFAQCRSFETVQYMHFTHKGKPWTHPKAWNRGYYLGEFPSEVQEFFRSWFALANSYCPRLIPSLD